MSQVQFRYRVAEPNLGPSSTPIPLSTGNPYLVASLKGGAGITIQAADNNVWLTGLFGLVIKMSSTIIDVSITRKIGAGAETTIFSQTIDYDPDEIDDREVITVEHVDVPGASGPISYFLYVSVEDGGAALSLPVSFAAQQNTP